MQILEIAEEVIEKEVVSIVVKKDTIQEIAQIQKRKEVINVLIVVKMVIIQEIAQIQGKKEVINALIVVKKDTIQEIALTRKK